MRDWTLGDWLLIFLGVGLWVRASMRMSIEVMKRVYDWMWELRVGVIGRLLRSVLQGLDAGEGLRCN